MPIRSRSWIASFFDRRRNESASCSCIVGVVGDPGAGVVAAAVGNENGNGPAIGCDLQRAVDDNFRRTRGRHRRTADGFAGLRSFDGMGGGEVPQLRHRECAAGVVHDPSSLAARDGKRGNAGALVASAERRVVGLGTVYARGRRARLGRGGRGDLARGVEVAGRRTAGEDCSSRYQQDLRGGLREGHAETGSGVDRVSEVGRAGSADSRSREE